MLRRAVDERVTEPARDRSVGGAGPSHGSRDDAEETRARRSAGVRKSATMTVSAGGGGGAG